LFYSYKKENNKNTFHQFWSRRFVHTWA